ncbi:hypothetical protein GCM10010106_31250 [Thermopolyspora flexuosa]|uniref:Uncharacterized protein DUF348 n=1 Tax=Thermopolyspora flexuosa TaxID=103836 RepID=A0A543ISQ8_9ACTN|nr:uncharacterized protein DUF348 [Thermopolyspora flexuosa]GGM82376.1 hypothetical protein GCM10010106_31250 [Thermopolyspora flexuosa]
MPEHDREAAPSQEPARSPASPPVAEGAAEAAGGDGQAQRRRKRPAPAVSGAKPRTRKGKGRPGRSRRISSILIGVAGSLVGGVSLGMFVVFGLAKEVHLMVDGEPIDIHTFADTVAEALERADVKIGPADYVSPKPTQRIADEGRIEVRHARKLTLIKDGRTTVHTVTALNVGDALEELDLDPDKVKLSASVMRQIPLTGLRLSVTTIREIDVVKDGRRIRMTTTARTIREALESNGITVGKDEKVRPKLSAFPEDGQVVRIIPVTPPRTEPIRPEVARLNWNALAQCETGGNPRAVDPAGTNFGMYAISLQMWRAVGGKKTPVDWPAEEQTYRAQLLYQKVEGRWQRQWPNCGSRLFD